jgi:hypothetical protein
MTRVQVWDDLRGCGKEILRNLFLSEVATLAQLDKRSHKLVRCITKQVLPAPLLPHKKWIYHISKYRYQAYFLLLVFEWLFFLFDIQLPFFSRMKWIPCCFVIFDLSQNIWLTAFLGWISFLLYLWLPLSLTTTTMTETSPIWWSLGFIITLIFAIATKRIHSLFHPLLDKELYDYFQLLFYTLFALCFGCLLILTQKPFLGKVVLGFTMFCFTWRFAIQMNTMFPTLFRPYYEQILLEHRRQTHLAWSRFQRGSVLL